MLVLSGLPNYKLIFLSEGEQIKFLYLQNSCMARQCFTQMVCELPLCYQLSIGSNYAAGFQNRYVCVQICVIFIYLLNSF